MDTCNAVYRLFRTAFFAGQPVRGRPLKIDIAADAKPTRARLRKYCQEQRDFLAKFVSQLFKPEMAYYNHSAGWACAPLLVPKLGTAGFVLTVDFRPINSFTVKHQYPIPNLELKLKRTAGSKFFALFDLSHGYWKLLLENFLQECQFLITLAGTYTSTRVLYQTTNAIMFLKATSASILPEALRANILSFLVDILIHATSIE